MKKILIKLILLYQSTPLSCHKACRFIPTCSEYTKQAIDKYGALKGLKLGIVPIHIRHEPDLYDPTKNENWIKSNKKFLELYE